MQMLCGMHRSVVADLKEGAGKPFECAHWQLIAACAATASCNAMQPSSQAIMQLVLQLAWSHPQAWELSDITSESGVPGACASSMQHRHL